MSSFQYTTPSFTIQLEDGDLDNYKTVLITIKKGSDLLELSNNDLSIDDSKNEISFSLSQEQTSEYKGTVSIQVNILYNNETRRTSEIMSVVFGKNLHEEIMS